MLLTNYSSNFLQNVLNETTRGTNGNMGLRVDATFTRESNQPYVKLRIENRSATTINQF